MAVKKVEGWAAAGMACLSAPPVSLLSPVSNSWPDPLTAASRRHKVLYASNLLINAARKPYTKSLTTKHLFNNSVLTLSTHERWKKQTLRFILSNKCAHLTLSQYSNNNKNSLNMFFFSVIPTAVAADLFGFIHIKTQHWQTVLYKQHGLLYISAHVMLFLSPSRQNECED